MRGVSIYLTQGQQCKYVSIWKKISLLQRLATLAQIQSFLKKCLSLILQRANFTSSPGICRVNSLAHNEVHKTSVFQLCPFSLISYEPTRESVNMR